MLTVSWTKDGDWCHFRTHNPAEARAALDAITGPALVTYTVSI